MSSQDSEKRATQHHRIPRAAKVAAGAAALVLAAGAAVVAGSSTGTLALWNDSADIPEATITVGSSQKGLSIAAGTQPGPTDQITIPFPAGALDNMLPGDIVSTPITVTNLDSKTYELGADIDFPPSANGDLRFALADGVCTPGAFTGIELSAAPTVLADPLLAGHTSKTFCLQVELSPTLAANKQGTQITPSFAMTIYGY